MELPSRWSLRGWLTLLVQGGAIVLLAILMIVSRQDALDRLDRQTHFELLDDLSSLQDLLHHASSAVSPLQVLAWSVGGFESHAGVRQAVVIAADGTILLSLHSSLIGKQADVVLPVAVGRLAPLSPRGIEAIPIAPYWVGTMAVSLGKGDLGRLLVVVDPSDRREAALAEIDHRMLLWGGAALVVWLGVWWRFQRSFVGRMSRLLEVERCLAAEDLSVRLNLKGEDELARLGHAFDNLIARLHNKQRMVEVQDERLRAILRHSPVMVFLKDADGRYLLGNRLLAHQAGCSEEELVGKSDRDLWPEAHARVLEEHDRQVLAAGSAAVFEESLGHNGDRRDFITVRFPLDAKEEGNARLGGIATDVTRDRAMRSRMRRKDELLACVADAAQRFLLAEEWGAQTAAVLERLGQAAEVDQVFLYREDSRLIHQWREGEEIRTQRAFLDALGLRWWKGALSHEGVMIRDAIAFTPSERKILEPQGIETMVMAPIITREGWWGFLALASCHPRQWSGGEIETLQAHAGLIAAVVLRWHAARDRARSEWRFQAVFEQSEIGMVVSSRDGRFLAVNPAFARMLEEQPEQLVGTTFESITHPDDRDRNLDLFERLIAGKIDHYSMEKRYVTRTGKIVWGHLLVRPLKEEGEVAILSLIEDITGQKEMAQALEQAEARYRDIVATSNEGFVAVDPGLRIVEINDAMLRILGYPRQGVEGQRIICFVAKAHWGQLRRWSRHPEEVPQREIELTALHAQGYPVELLMSISPMHREGRLEGFAAFASDLSQRKRLDQAILAAKVFERTSEAVVITDGNANIVDVNDAWERITGYRREEVVGRNPRMMQSGRHDKAFYQTMWQSLMEQGRWEGEIWDRRKDGAEYPKHLVIDAVRGEEGAVTHYVGIFTDITEAKAREDRLHHMAHRDHLTGLPNRMLFSDRLEQAMQRSRRSGELLAVLFLDLDGFKTINDTLGHHVGDEVLVEVGRRLIRAVRQSDTVCRLGGDEFTMLLGDVDGVVGVKQVSDKVLETLALPIVTEAGMQMVTASIGIALFPGDGETPDALLQAADLAMYRAKALGKNRYHLAGDYTFSESKST